MSEEEFREFIREQTLRHEHATRTMDRWLQTVDRRVEETVERTEQIVRRTDEVIEEMRRLRKSSEEESRAQRQALFAILDRLEGGAQPSAG